MKDLSQDSVVNVIYEGINAPIKLLAEHGYYPAAITLTYSGMDTMAFLDMPAGKNEVSRGDFVRWAEQYIRFPCEERVSGLEIYSARCSALHSHGIDSTLTRQRKCRMIGYGDHMVPKVRYEPKLSEGLE